MLLLPGGEFLMGTDDGDPHERPRHSVRVSPFLLDETPASRRQFAIFLTLWGSECDDGGRRLLDPDVAGLRRSGSWWEPETDDEGPVTGVTWYGASAFARWAGVQLPSEAQLEFAFAVLTGNGLGTLLTQLVGSGRFWCADGYDEGLYAHGPSVDPANAPRGAFVSVRGTSRLSGPRGWSRTRRDFATPHEAVLDIGLRCALPWHRGSGQSR